MNQELKDLVIVRLETLPSNRKISIGSFGEFGKEDLIRHVKEEDEIGKKIMQIELEFLQALKNGIIA